MNEWYISSRRLFSWAQPIRPYITLPGAAAMLSWGQVSSYFFSMQPSSVKTMFFCSWCKEGRDTGVKSSGSNPHSVLIWTQVTLAFAGVDISGMNLQNHLHLLLLSWGPWPLCSRQQPHSGTVDQGRSRQKASYPSSKCLMDRLSYSTVRSSQLLPNDIGKYVEEPQRSCCSPLSTFDTLGTGLDHNESSWPRGDFVYHRLASGSRRSLLT